MGELPFNKFFGVAVIGRGLFRGRVRQLMEPVHVQLTNKTIDVAVLEITLQNVCAEVRVVRFQEENHAIRWRPIYPLVYLRFQED